MYESSIGRVSTAEGKSIGTAFMVAENLALSALHVVSAEDVDYQLTFNEQSFSVSIEDVDQRLDVALLRLEEDTTLPPPPPPPRLLIAASAGPGLASGRLASLTPVQCANG